MFVVISHGLHDYLIDITIGKLPYQDPPELYTILEILDFLGIARSEYTGPASNKGEVHERIRLFGNLIQQHCLDILRGDEDLLSRLDYFTLPERRRYNYRMRHGEDPGEGWDPRSDNWWI